MDILLSRIIRYLNGVITLYDNIYCTALFMVEHYQELRCKTLEEIVKESEYTEEDIMTFIGYLGYHDYGRLQRKTHDGFRNSSLFKSDAVKTTPY